MSDEPFSLESAPTTDTPAPAFDPKTDLLPWFFTLETAELPWDWARLFGNANPVELDIGCGRGLFLVTASQANPQINYLGMELDFKEGRRGARRLKKRNSPNGRVIGGDATVTLAQHIPPHSVSAAHVYFPDPWWKRKHHRRRIFTESFVGLLSRVLIHGGLLHSWTDVPEYFEVIAGLMNHHADFITLPPPAERTPQHEMDYQTSFERRKRMDGLPIHRGLWQRRPL